MNKPKDSRRSALTLFSLVLGGEAVFFLPFVLARIFRPTLLDFYGIGNLELGYYFSIYGIIAMVSYPFGGFLADIFPARKLMAISLWITAIGGLITTIWPYSGILPYLYALWAITSILLYWAAMIRATREWGGQGFQGRAFGWLEGGRGATAAILGSITFIAFSYFSMDSKNSFNQIQGFHPYQFVLLVTVLITLIGGILIWFFVPENKVLDKRTDFVAQMKDIKILILNPSVWLLSLIIICAYVGYKITDVFSLYAHEVLGFTERNAAGVGTAALWLRALVAIFAGYLGDRISKSNLIPYAFFISMVFSAILAFGLLPHVTFILILNMAFIAIGVYSVRALYFALLKDAQVDVLLTGSAVGFISFIGFTPDIFMSPWMGSILDNNPGEIGHQLVFGILTAFSLAGLILGLLFKLLKK